MKIPTSFYLMGQRITVELDNKLRHQQNLLGYASGRESAIKLQGSTESNPINMSQVEQTFLHELTHMILDTMNELELSKNEKFVDVFAGLLHQAMISSDGELL